MRVADLGAGAGVIGLSLALRGAVGGGGGGDDVAVDVEGGGGVGGAAVRVLLVEQQPSLARRCARNAALNGVGHRVRVWRGDVARISPVAIGRRSSCGGSEDVHAADVDLDEVREWIGRCDAVVCNPPYFPSSVLRAAGTQPKLDERRLAHYETNAGLAEFAAAAAALLKPQSLRAAPTTSPTLPSPSTSPSPGPALHFVVGGTMEGVHVCDSAKLPPSHATHATHAFLCSDAITESNTCPV